MQAAWQPVSKEVGVRCQATWQVFYETLKC